MSTVCEKRFEIMKKNVSDARKRAKQERIKYIGLYVVKNIDLTTMEIPRDEKLISCLNEMFAFFGRKNENIPTKYE